MARVKFVQRSGSERDVEIGENVSVMLAAVRSRIGGIDGQCGGYLDFATCHVYVEATQARLLPPPGDEELRYDGLIIATGSRARRIDVPDAECDGVCYLRSLTGAIDLKARLKHAAEIVVIGGRFIGLEVASSAAKLAKKVTVVESASRILKRAISPLVSSYLLDTHAQHGVKIILGDTVTAMEQSGTRIAGVRLASGTRLPADLVLVGIGGIANDELAAAAGLNCRNGIVVDEHGRTEAPDICAAGDCA